MQRRYSILLGVIILLVIGFLVGNFWRSYTVHSESNSSIIYSSPERETPVMEVADAKHQLIVVFKKSVAEDQAIAMVTSWNVNFSEGMDSSKGKAYFYETGEKFILTFENEEDLNTFKNKRYQFLTEVHEIYTPDWDIKKD